ncbi:MAG: ATP-binding protein, partial [Chitinophagales bacterium]
KQGLLLAKMAGINSKIYRSYHGISSTLIDSAGLSPDASQLYDEALQYLRIFLVSEDAAIDVRQYADAYNNAGLAFQYKQYPDADSAMYFYKKAIALYRQYSLPGACVAMSNIGLLYMQKNDFVNAVAYLEESNKDAFRENNKIVLRTNYQSLANLYYHSGDTRKAYNYLTRFIAYDDSLFNEEKSKIIAELQTKFETAQKEQIIAKQQAEQALQEQRIAKKEQTIRIVFGAALASLIIAALLFNRRPFKRKLEFKMQLLNDRTRISSDLHDDIGSTLGSISYFSQLANRVNKESNAAELQELLDKIQEVAQEAVDSMSDIVWTINPKNDEAEKLILRMHKYASDIVDASVTRYNVEYADELTGLNFTMAQRKNIFLIFKEALYNAVKYAQCSAITVCFKRDAASLNMRITDNGIGFDLRDTQSYNGNGLRNMQKRAEELNGTLQIVSKKGAGTIVALSVPI